MTAGPGVDRRARHGSIAFGGMILCLALLAACSNNGDRSETSGATESTTASEDPIAVARTRVDEAEAGVVAANGALTAAREDFCGSAKGYVETLDRYGRVFTDQSATVGDVQTLGADLEAPRQEVVSTADIVQAANNDLAAAQQDLLDAQAALAAAVAATSSPTPSPTGPSTVTTPALLPATTIERVQQAEEDLARAARGINADTALVDAGATYNSAALALEIAWLKLLDDAKCVTDERRSDALAQITAYTSALQTDLREAGYDPGPIDGVYGPQTVAAVEKLQTDSGLPATGYVDEATARALNEKLGAVGQQQATQTAAVQTILTLTGYWNDPVNGQWTDELTQALMDFQTALGVKPTGEVDSATVAAFDKALSAARAAVTASAASATVTVSTTATAATTAIAAPGTVTATITAAPTTVTATTTVKAPPSSSR